MSATYWQWQPSTGHTKIYLDILNMMDDICKLHWKNILPLRGVRVRDWTASVTGTQSKLSSTSAVKPESKGLLLKLWYTFETRSTNAFDIYRQNKNIYLFILKTINNWKHGIIKRFFFQHNFCVKPYVPKEPGRNPSIVGSMNMGYISDTAGNRTHNLFRPKCEPIPLRHSDGQRLPTGLLIQPPGF